MPHPAWFKPRLTQADYQQIRDMKERGIQQVRIAAFIGCTQAHVSDVLLGKVAGAREVPKNNPPEAQL